MDAAGYVLDVIVKQRLVAITDETSLLFMGLIIGLLGTLFGLRKIHKFKIRQTI